MTEQELLETEATHIVATGESSFAPTATPAAASTPAPPGIDWDAAAYHETTVEETFVEERYDTVTPAYAPRGRWDFTEAQRIILSLLLWLNIVILTLVVLILTGHFDLG